MRTTHQTDGVTEITPTLLHLLWLVQVHLKHADEAAAAEA
jgi:hypothetical protein